MEQKHQLILVPALFILLSAGCIGENSEQNLGSSSTTCSISTSLTSTSSTTTTQTSSTTSYTTTSHYITTTTTSTTTSSSTTTHLDCRDTDGGMQYHVHGTVIHIDGRVVNDICEGDMLREYYCSKGEIKSTYYNCRYGCQDGICLRKE